MKISYISSFFFLLLSFSYCLKAQNSNFVKSTTFNIENNKIKNLKIKNSKISISNNILCKYENSVYEKSITNFNDLINNCLINIKESADFYSWLWNENDYEQLISELDLLKIHPPKSLSPNNFSTYKELASIINDTIINRNNNIIFSTHSIIRRDPVKALLIAYYNKQIKYFDELKYISKAEINTHINILNSLKDTANSLLSYIYLNKNISDITSERIKKYNQYFDTHSSITRVKQILKNDWFKRWLWFTQGKIKFNPLEYSNNIVNDYDSIKSSLYEIYIDSSINKMIKKDTSYNFDLFKNILKEKNTGYQQFKKNTIVKLNEQKKLYQKKINESYTLIHQIEVPSNFNKEKYMLVDFSNIKYVNPKSLSKPIALGERKNYLIYNIPQELELKLLENQAEIKHESKSFQNSIGELADFVVELSSLIPSGFQYLPIKPHYEYSASRVNPDNSLDKGNAHKYLIAGISSMGPFNKEDIHKYKKIQNLVDTFKLYPDKEKNNSQDTNSFYTQFIINGKSEKYFVMNKSKYDLQDTIDLLNNCYNKCINLIEILSGFTKYNDLLNELKTDFTDIPLYASATIHSSVYDFEVKQNINIISSVKEKKLKDSTSLLKFSYSVGKGQRIQLGAGISYSFKDYIRNSISSYNGSINITSFAPKSYLSAGINIYPLGRGLFSQDKRIFGNVFDRTSIYLGVSVPKPLDNFFFGVSYDLVPGFKIVSGPFLHRDDKYDVINNSIANQRVKYKFDGIYASFIIDPISLLNILKILKSE